MHIAWRSQPIERKEVYIAGQFQFVDLFEYFYADAVVINDVVEQPEAKVSNYKHFVLKRTVDQQQCRQLDSTRHQFQSSQ